MIIVYESNAGHTERYAKIIAEATGLEAKPRKEVKKTKEEVVYLGWIKAGKIAKIKKAIKKYNIVVIGAVGMAPEESPNYRDNLVMKNETNEIPLYYMRGGLEEEKLEGLNKAIIMALKRYSTKESPDGTVSTVFNDGDYVNEKSAVRIVKEINTLLGK